MDLPFYKICDAATLSASIEAAGLARGERFLGTACDPDLGITWVVLPNDATGVEITLVTDTVNAFSELQAAKTKKTEELNMACQSYILSRYDPPKQASLNALLTEAAILGYQNRIGYIAGALAWIKSVIAHYYTKSDAITAAATVQAVEDVTWDFTSFNASDPGITLRAASEMAN